MLRRRHLALGAAVLAVAGIGGGAYAATQPTPRPRQAFLDDVAKRLDVSPARLRQAFRAALADQAARPGAFLRPRRLLGPRPFLRRRGGLGLMARRGPLAAAARYLGLTEMQLFGQLRAGKSLAEVAQARGKSVAGMERAMLSAIRAQLDRAINFKGHVFHRRFRGGFATGPQPPPPGGFSPPAVPPSAGGPPPGSPPA